MLYIPRTLGSRGLIQLELSLKTTRIGFEAYLTKNNDPFLEIGKYQIHFNNKEYVVSKKQHNIPEMLPTNNEENNIYAKRINEKT